MVLALSVEWADGAPTSTEQITVAPRSRWERSLAQYRDVRGNANAVVRVTANQITGVFVAIWFGADYGKAGGYGYLADRVCVK